MHLEARANEAFSIWQVTFFVYFYLFIDFCCWSCDLTSSITMPTCTCNMYHTIQNVWLWWINHQSQSVTQVPVICHHGNILIALWCKLCTWDSFHNWASVLSKTPQRSLVISILRWIFFNITWFIDNLPLKRSRQWLKHVRHAFYWFVFVILYF